MLEKIIARLGLTVIAVAGMLVAGLWGDAPRPGGGRAAAAGAGAERTGA
jgi:hypothetical protein